MSLRYLHDEHGGKITDTWSLYVEELDRVLSVLRDKQIAILEIGVQNGGSLEIWSEYFPQAQKIIGVDIDPKCGKLHFADPRISVVVCDATSGEGKRKVLQQAPAFDVIIDDGSHKSSDIVRAFGHYFPVLNEGGFYIVEDLHSSYWADYEGGLHNPLSAMAFFRRLADITNYEHWRNNRSREYLLREFSAKYEVRFENLDLAMIHSVGFVNSLCIIGKAAPGSNVLGKRIVAGAEEYVTSIYRKTNQALNPDIPVNIHDISVNIEDDTMLDIFEVINANNGLQEQLAEKEQTPQHLQTQLTERDGQIGILNQTVAEREGQISSLNQAVAERDGQITAILSSTSWRLTRPLRWVADHLKRMRRWFRFSLRTVLFAPKRFDAKWYLKQNPDVAMSGMDPYKHYILFGKTEGRKLAPDVAIVRSNKSSVYYLLRIAPQIIAQKGGIRRTCAAVLRVYRREGLAGVNCRIKQLQTGPHPNLVNTEDFCSTDYSSWVSRYDTLTDETRAKMRQVADGFAHKPLISVVMPCYNPKPEWLKEAIESVRRQLYPHWELCIADDASTDPAIRPILEDYSRRDARIKVVFRTLNGHISAASNSALTLATGEYVALLDHDDLLAEHALFWVAEVINRHPDAGLIYSDEDKITESGQCFDPYFKCDWNYDLFLSQNMISHLGVYKTGLLRKIGGFREGLEGSQDYDLALRCIEQLDPSQIIHIPRVLYHWRAHLNSAAQNVNEKLYAYVAAELALNEHLSRKGVSAQAERHPENCFYRVRYALPEPAPLVTLIILTRNGLRLIRQCLSSILEKTDYPNYEILVVDNGSDDPQTLAYFDSVVSDPRLRILRDDRPFNFSALNNRAVQAARGELVGLVNNDIEVISPQWLTELVSIALQPGVGTVGARLWYSDNRLQHGGVVLGVGGVAGHSHKYLPKGHPGYVGRAVLQQSFSAVTAACLVVRRSIFLEVGGFEEENLKIAFGDVDFCLWVREAGYRNVWTPYAELYHHESATRGCEDTPEKQARFAGEVRYMQDRWGSLLLNDPAYSPNLTLDSEDFSYACPPRVAPFDQTEV